MIKINLASKKKAAGLTAGGDGGGGATRLNVSTEGLKTPAFRRALIYVVLAFALNFLIEDETTEELNRIDKKIAEISAQQTKASAELAKNNSYNDLKKSLDSDEQILRTKLEVIRKLSATSAQPSKPLIALSGGIPREVWLDDYSVETESIRINGQATGFESISEFMRALSESAFYRDVTLASSDQIKDELGVEFVKFSISAKGRE